MVTSLALADEFLPDTGTAEKSADQYLAPNTTLERDYCPLVTKLTKNPDDQTWGADGGWKSNAPSFITELTTFVGAQWVGVSVGEIICLYARAGRAEFPVAIQRGTLVPVPKVGGLWSEDKGGYRECISTDIQNCPFFIEIHTPPKDVYKDLDFYKGKAVQSEGN